MEITVEVYAKEYELAKKTAKVNEELEKVFVKNPKEVLKMSHKTITRIADSYQWNRVVIRKGDTIIGEIKRGVMVA